MILKIIAKGIGNHSAMQTIVHKYFIKQNKKIEEKEKNKW